MRLLKLTLVAVILMLVVYSCKTDLADGLVVKSGLPIDTAQAHPPVKSGGSGTINAVYNKTSHSLTYTITWTGLTGNITAMHIHGPAFKGFSGAIFQTISGFVNGTAGTYSGSLYFDEVAAKEADLLHGEYYVDIHTSSNPSPAALEIRGQIEF